MPVTLDVATERALTGWVEASIGAKQPAHARGYQGAVYLYETHGRRFAIKAALGAGMRGWLARSMLRREFAAYRRLDGFTGSPRCYGLLKGRYLVLDYVDGVPLRSAEITDRRMFFDTLFAHIAELHRRGVAHADLKRKDNLLVIDGRLPCLVDFGAAVLRPNGFAPMRRYLYGIAQRFDLNAWAKLKYQGRLDEITPEDRLYYRRTRIETLARAVKHTYLRYRRRLTD